jgi:hypothetical protein
MQREIPHLEFLAIDQLIIHEWHDIQRTEPLVQRIRQSGLWRNPPVVTLLDDGSGRYMVLDGANRYTALERMGIPHILVQVVEAESPGLELQNWNHVVWEMDPLEFQHRIRSIPETELVPSSILVEPDLWGSCGLALIHLANHEIYSLCTDETELVRRVDMLNSLVKSYKDSGRLDRTLVRELSNLEGYYPQLCGLVVFPMFEVSDIMALAGAGYLLPAGITRFTISPRALHVNYPLSELAADKPLAEKNAQLQLWIQERVASKGIRYYAEPTFLFDE